jgi:hypothetical protein
VFQSPALKMQMPYCTPSLLKFFCRVVYNGPSLGA